MWQGVWAKIFFLFEKYAAAGMWNEQMNLKCTLKGRMETLLQL